MATTLLAEELHRVHLALVQKKIAAAIPAAAGTLRDAASHLLCAGGKHVRPSLVLLSALAVQSDDALDDAVYDVAAAAELIHVASLIHDDVIDKAFSRRNLPSVNARFGNHTAVLAGDYLFAAAFKLLEKHADRGVVTLMTEAIAAMCHGEVLQKEQAFDPDTSQGDYFRRIYGKTAALLAACCEAGARLAGAPPSRTRRLRAFGVKVGLAYQIADDVLDWSQSSEALGKPADSDLRQGVLTLPVIVLLQDDAWRRRIAPALRRRQIDDETVEAVRQGMQTSGTLAFVRRIGERLAKEASDHLSLAFPGSAANVLLQLSRRAVSRNR